MQSGVAFLGTPNPTNMQREQWQKLTPLLRSCSITSKIILVRAELEAHLVANLSKDFKEAEIDVPIVSAFEKKKTKIPGRWFTSERKIVRTTHLSIIRVFWIS